MNEFILTNSIKYGIEVIMQYAHNALLDNKYTLVYHLTDIIMRLDYNILGVHEGVFEVELTKIKMKVVEYPEQIIKIIDFLNIIYPDETILFIISGYTHLREVKQSYYKVMENLCLKSLREPLHIIYYMEFPNEILLKSVNYKVFLLAEKYKFSYIEYDYEAKQLSLIRKKSMVGKAKFTLVSTQIANYSTLQVELNEIIRLFNFFLLKNKK